MFARLCIFAFLCTPLPHHLSLASQSFRRLLFNTDENPYKKYVSIDPLLGAVAKTRDVVEDEIKKLGAAPETIRTGEHYQGVEVKGGGRFKWKNRDRR